jgi:hypothetical protein
MRVPDGLSPLIISANADALGSGDDDDEAEDDAEQLAHDEAIREQRRAHASWANRLRRWALASMCFLVCAALVAVGVAEMIAAEIERQHGWTLTSCHVVNAFGHNDSHCVYFGAMTAASPVPMCAVPATIASSVSFMEPPACHGNATPDAADVAYWRSVRESNIVECFVPSDVRYGVALSTCVASTTGGHTVAALVWRTWLERLVYLTRTPREGLAAIESITAVRTRTGIALASVGALGLFVLIVLVRRFCAVPNITERRRTARMAQHKIP